MLQKVSLFINNNFITTTCRVYFVTKSKDHEQLFHSLASYGHKFFHSRIYRPPFKLRVRRALEHPSFFLYPLVGSVLAKVKDVPLSCPWNSRFPAFPLFHHPRTIFLRSLEWAGTKKGTKTERFCFRSPRFIDIWGN